MDVRAIADHPHLLHDLGKVLRCPICLSLCKTAANLPCSHAFCSACLGESLKNTSACPVCRVPATKREIRPARHVDALVHAYARIECATGLQLIASQIPSDTEEEEEEVVPESPFTNSERSLTPLGKAGSETSLPAESQQHQQPQSKMSTSFGMGMSSAPWKQHPCGIVGDYDMPRKSSLLRTSVPPRKRDRWPTNLGVKRVNNGAMDEMEGDDDVDELDAEDGKRSFHGGRHELLSDKLDGIAMSRAGHVADDEVEKDCHRHDAVWDEGKVDVNDDDAVVADSFVSEELPAGRWEKYRRQHSAFYARSMRPSVPSVDDKLGSCLEGVGRQDADKWNPSLEKTSPAWASPRREPLFWAKYETTASEDGGAQVPLTQPSQATVAKRITFSDLVEPANSDEATVEFVADLGDSGKQASQEKLAPPLPPAIKISEPFVRKCRSSMSKVVPEVVNMIANGPSLRTTPYKKNGHGSKPFQKHKVKNLEADVTVCDLLSKEKVANLNGGSTGDVAVSARPVVAGKHTDRWATTGGRVGKIKSWMSRRDSVGSASSRGDEAQWERENRSECALDELAGCTEASILPEQQRWQEEGRTRDRDMAAASRDGIFCSSGYLPAETVKTYKRRVLRSSAGGGVSNGGGANTMREGAEEQVCEDMAMAEKWRVRAAGNKVGKVGKIVKNGKKKSARSKKAIENGDVSDCKTESEGEMEDGERGNNGCAERPSAKHGSCDLDGTAVACDNGVPVCSFCCQAGDSRVSGALMFYSTSGGNNCLVPASSEQQECQPSEIPGTYVHRTCATWAPNVYFKGSKICNLEAEMNRSRRIRCASCSKPGAALGCFVQRCPKSFHYECGWILDGSRFDEDNFVMLCPDHSKVDFPWEAKAKKVRSKKRQRRNEGNAESEGGEGADKVLKETKLGRDYEERALKKKTTKLRKMETPPPLKLRKKSSTDALNQISSPLACTLPLSSPSAFLSARSQKKSDRPSVIMCVSGLDDKDKDLVLRFESTATGVLLERQWSPSVTHLVASVNSDNCAKRTLKYLFSVLRGQWVVSPRWLTACLEEGRLVGEAPFEVFGDVHGALGGPKTGRDRRSYKMQPLFAGHTFYLFGEFAMPSKSDVSKIIVAGGGTLLSRKPRPEDCCPQASADEGFIGSMRVIIIYNGNMAAMPEERSSEAAMAAKSIGREDGIRTPAVARWKEACALAAITGPEVVAVSHMWLLDTASSCRLRDTALYSGPPSRK